MELFQRPPDRLDVARVHRPVGLVGVDPEPDPLREALEGIDVSLDASFATSSTVRLPARSSILFRRSGAKAMFLSFLCVLIFSLR